MSKKKVEQYLTELHVPLIIKISYSAKRQYTKTKFIHRVSILLKIREVTLFLDILNLYFVLKKWIHRVNSVNSVSLDFGTYVSLCKIFLAGNLISD